jgi:hypothetical protein
MAYTADINRMNPACFLFLIDQSGSMTIALAGQPNKRKIDQAALAINRILDTMVQRCSQGMEVLDYFHIGVIGYSTDQRANAEISSVFPETTLEDPFLTVSEVANVAELEERELKVSDGAGGLVDVTQEVPVWLLPFAQWGTPMCAALDVAHRALDSWIGQHPTSYPPIVINVSDGAASDGDPESFAQKVMGLSTNDGNTLLFNVHLSEVPATPIQYPDREDILPQNDEFAALMFRMSSILPESSRAQATVLDLPIGDQSRGYVFNADMTALVQFLDIGTRAASSLQ